MTIYRFKPRFQALLRPAVARLAATAVTANHVTVAAAAGSLLVGGACALSGGAPTALLLLPAWLIARMALNAADGMLAREHGQASALGAYLNELGDMVSDAALILPFALVPPFAGGWVAFVAVLAAIVESAGVLGPSVGATRRYDGPMGKSDRALVLGALGLWAGLAAPLPEATAWIMPALAALLVWTAVRRVRAGLAEGRADRRP